MKIKRNRYIGIVEEPEFGTQDILTPAVILDIASTSLDTPSNTNLFYTGGLGRGTSKVVPGAYMPEGEIQYAADLHSIGYFLKWALGQYIVTDQADGIKLHEFYRTEYANLPSFQAQVGKDIFEHIFIGCTINSLTFEISNEFLNITANVLAKNDIINNEIHDINPQMLPQNMPIAFHQVTAKINGIDESAKIKSFTLAIENNLNGEDGMGIGSRYTNRHIAGESNINLSMELYFDDTSKIADLQSGQIFPIEISIMDLNQKDSMIITLPKCIYEVVNQQPSGRDEIVQSVECKTLMDYIELTDGTIVPNDIHVVLINSQPNY